MKDAWFSYPDGTEALRGVSVRILSGEKVAIVGATGAGKSTLLLLFNGCLLPARGEVRVEGVPVTPKTLPTVRRTVGLVFQDPDDQLFMPTVAEDVAFGPLHMGLSPQEAHRRVDGALRQVGMEHLKSRPPFRLSVGQKRAVAIATVLAIEPHVLVLDEPSAHLDPRARRGLIQWLQGFDRTLVVSTHDLDMVVHVCHRTVVLSQGRVVADGPTEKVLDDEELMELHGLERPRVLALRRITT